MHVLHATVIDCGEWQTWRAVEFKVKSTISPTEINGRAHVEPTASSKHVITDVATVQLQLSTTCEKFEHINWRLQLHINSYTLIIN